MGIHILDAMAREGFEEVIALHDRDSGLRGFLGIHDSSQGPAFGGIRRWSYLTEDQALRDCLRLARAMTYKCAIAGLEAGGAKLVVLDRPGLDVEAVYRAIGASIERLGGRYQAGPDVGTQDSELEWVAATTRHVTDPGPGGPGMLAEATAEGVFAGIGASLRFLDGEEDWPRRRIVIQGLGEVGRGLARRLLERGARVGAAEIDPDRVAAVRVESDVEILDPATELDARCDVFAPCALGGILHDLSITRLRCRIVAGGANNVLARAVHGERLHQLGILYAPDFAINAGALVRGTIHHLEGRRESIERIGARIGATLADLLAQARAAEVSPARYAVDLAEDRIAQWRARAPSQDAPLGPTVR